MNASPMTIIKISCKKEAHLPLHKIQIRPLEQKYSMQIIKQRRAS